MPVLESEFPLASSKNSESTGMSKSPFGINPTFGMVTAAYQSVSVATTKLSTSKSTSPF